MTIVLDPILCQAAEDETAIAAQVQWNQATDELIGFCGKSGKEHRCVQDCTIKVGDSYADLTEAFQRYTVGSYARVIMINPLHPHLPAFPVFLMPTCNRFTTEDVRAQWIELERLYNQHLLNVLGPLIGESPGSKFLFSLLSKLPEKYNQKHKNLPLNFQILASVWYY